MLDRLFAGRLSVRAKLLVIVLSPTLLALPAIAGFLAYWGNAYYDRLLVYKISSDLVIADQYLERVLEGFGREAQAFADSSRLARALGSVEAVGRELAAARAALGFDFLALLDAKGGIAAVSGAETLAANHAFWPVVGKALAGRPGAGIDVYSPEQLRELDPALEQRAYLQVVATPNAAQDAKTEERRGMMIHTASPVLDAQGKVLGVIEGGVLLNGNLAFVDRINEIVYKEGSLPLGSRGTTTLFLDDVRIATNVRMFEDRRALGTRVSLAVRDHVLGQGKVWQDKALVIDDWYVSGYQPIYDTFQRRVGMLYVGYLETPFQRAKWTALAAMTGLFALLATVGMVLFMRWARTIFAPLERMSATVSAVERGQAEARVGKVASRDEIGELARHFDALLDTLASQARDLRELNADLDRKVAERTAQLEAAQKQLVTSEKLAAIGQLTAGVAHEINNPIAVMQGNLDIIRAECGPHLAPVANELRLIDEQINRIRVIITELLQFARPDDYAGYTEDVEPDALMADTVLLVRHLLAKGGIEVRQRPGATRTVHISRNELQQVLVNLVMNAIHAMPSGGVLTLSTGDWGESGLALSVADTGVGIPAENLTRIFDPFFTTKKREGTGLGLSISYALVERYGGRITVESEVGRGSTFTVWLPGGGPAPGA